LVTWAATLRQQTAQESGDNRFLGLEQRDKIPSKIISAGLSSIGDAAEFNAL
jgi:hypothetical protein